MAIIPAGMNKIHHTFHKKLVLGWEFECWKQTKGVPRGTCSGPLLFIIQRIGVTKYVFVTGYGVLCYFKGLTLLKTETDFNTNYVVVDVLLNSCY